MRVFVRRDIGADLPSFCVHAYESLYEIASDGSVTSECVFVHSPAGVHGCVWVFL